MQKKVSDDQDENRFASFDLDDPDLPKWIKQSAMRSAGYPYDDRMSRGDYEEQLKSLQYELLKLQYWLKDEGKRLVMLFEGRDAAGKGGTIKRFIHYLNPRFAHVVALSKPTDTERGQWYFQRYVAHLPTAGDMSFFDRSWYNRAGVEPVMGFCSPDQHDQFLQEAPAFEKALVRDGIHLVKFWLTVGREMQLKRFHDRRHDPLKHWKLSPIDVASLSKWQAYTDARDKMFDQTHTDQTPWTVVRSNDKRRARLNAIRHVLSLFNYEGKDVRLAGEVDEKILGSGSEFFKSA